jgi:hypothetical protein
MHIFRLHRRGPGLSGLVQIQSLSPWNTDPEELYPEIGLDTDHYKHRYLLVTFEEKDKKQRKLRWYVGTSDPHGSFFFRNPAPSRPDGVNDLPLSENGDLASALRDYDPD